MAPPFARDVVADIVETVLTTEPKAHRVPGRGRTPTKLRQWVAHTSKRAVSRAARHGMPAAAGLSWKTCKTLLGKRNRRKRAALLERFAGLFDRVHRREVGPIRVDESHVHRAPDPGWSWGRIGERRRVSGGAPVSNRISGFEASNVRDGRCLIWADGSCHEETTVEFLHRIDDWTGQDGREVVVIWDGAPGHRAKIAPQTAREWGLTLVALPGYSPNRNPISDLGTWVREEVTPHHGHAPFENSPARANRSSLRSARTRSTSSDASGPDSTWTRSRKTPVLKLNAV